MTEEEQETGEIAWSSYLSYLLSLVPWWAIIPFLLITVLGEGLNAYASLWMGMFIY